VKLISETGRHRPGEFIFSMLSDDHAALDRLFQEVVAEARCGEPGAMRASWRRFEFQLGTHLDLEDQEILPDFVRQHPDEGRAILDEHARIRATLAEMGLDLDLHCLRADRVEAFVALLRAHAQREEALLYPWASRGDH
jgi:hemerythrin-like domain-containing protein